MDQDVPSPRSSISTLASPRNVEAPTISVEKRSAHPASDPRLPDVGTAVRSIWTSGSMTTQARSHCPCAPTPPPKLSAQPRRSPATSPTPESPTASRAVARFRVVSGDLRYRRHLALVQCPDGGNPHSFYPANAPLPRHPNDRDHIVTRVETRPLRRVLPDLPHSLQEAPDAIEAAIEEPRVRTFRDIDDDVGLEDSSQAAETRSGHKP